MDFRLVGLRSRAGSIHTITITSTHTRAHERCFDPFPVGFVSVFKLKYYFFLSFLLICYHNNTVLSRTRSLLDPGTRVGYSSRVLRVDAGVFHPTPTDPSRPDGFFVSLKS